MSTPAQAPTFETALATSLAAIADGQSKTDGINVGKAVAAQWLALRASDGLEAAITFTPGHGPGIWEPVPTYPASPPTICAFRPRRTADPGDDGQRRSEAT